MYGKRSRPNPKPNTNPKPVKPNAYLDPNRIPYHDPYPKPKHARNPNPNPNLDPNPFPYSSPKPNRNPNSYPYLSVTHTANTRKPRVENVEIVSVQRSYIDKNWKLFRYLQNERVTKHGRKNPTNGKKRLEIYRGKLQAGNWRVDDVRQNRMSKRNQIR